MLIMLGGKLAKKDLITAHTLIDLKKFLGSENDLLAENEPLHTIAGIVQALVTIGKGIENSTNDNDRS